MSSKPHEAKGLLLLRAIHLLFAEQNTKQNHKPFCLSETCKCLRFLRQKENWSPGGVVRLEELERPGKCCGARVFRR